ncbi:hypothetical protein EDEG_02567 [Edhazardia aedis USNM 41457]|uniref:Uncharacterized protein n=1 Tax=Edhazardia aedis (strain USNM 41457) TaxID=1003232 RepID=J8ZTT2_EDHAE|nr:hypothetical protein EDEG_02567 [Edhazardia aedis USNM 41457]|eukprot:EJW03048.1 hypothetical protein EDEG_02567 [Edhazardia aedis USNM 41457]
MKLFLKVSVVITLIFVLVILPLVPLLAPFLKQIYTESYFDNYKTQPKYSNTELRSIINKEFRKTIILHIDLVHKKLISRDFYENQRIKIINHYDINKLKENYKVDNTTFSFMKLNELDVLKEEKKQ